MYYQLHLYQVSTQQTHRCGNVVLDTSYHDRAKNVKRIKVLIRCLACHKNDVYVFYINIYAKISQNVVFPELYETRKCVKFTKNPKS